jgi:membrane-bound serine protease (ClpP class)
MLGIAGIYFELSNPGAIFPGVIGGISIILALYASQSIPINFAGILLILLAVILFILEIKVTSYGLLTVGGVVSLFLGSVMLFKSNLEFQRPSMWTIILTVVCVAAFFIAVIALAAKAYLRRPSTGKEGIVGKRGVAKTNINEDEGKAYVYGEWWDAVSDTPIKKGEKVEVVESLDLGVKVKKI